MTSCRLVAEAIAIARKLRDAPNNGDAARHEVDVAAHVLDVTRSGAASAGAAKARHARAGAPLVVRVVLLALVLILFAAASGKSHAGYGFNGNCYKSFDSANSAFKSSYPQYGETKATYIYSHTVTGANTMDTYILRVSPDGSSTNTRYIWGFQPCDEGYSGEMDKLPIAELIYVICIGMSGLLGFSVGVRLV